MKPTYFLNATNLFSEENSISLFMMRRNLNWLTSVYIEQLQKKFLNIRFGIQVDFSETIQEHMTRCGVDESQYYANNTIFIVAWPYDDIQLDVRALTTNSDGVIICRTKALVPHSVSDLESCVVQMKAYLQNWS